MTGPDSSFNHVGICVTDLERSRRFYVEALGFSPWWELEVPDEAAGPLLQLPTPLGTRAVYLANGRFVLELLHYRQRPGGESAGERTMADSGLTHLSLAVDDIGPVLESVEALGGEILRSTDMGGAAIMIRDPDGQLIELTTRHFPSMRPPWPDEDPPT